MFPTASVSAGSAAGLVIRQASPTWATASVPPSDAMSNPETALRSRVRIVRSRNSVAGLVASRSTPSDRATTAGLPVSRA